VFLLFLLLSFFFLLVFRWKSILWKQTTFQRVPSERERRPVFKVDRNQMEIRKGMCRFEFVLPPVKPKAPLITRHLIIDDLKVPNNWTSYFFFVGPDQALQSDTEQSRKEEATRRTRELLHLVHRSRRRWRWWARRGHQGWHLAQPPAVLPGTFTSMLKSPRDTHTSSSCILIFR